MTSHAPIGVFDSGIGGLTVVRAIHALLPAESTLYLGDTARVPYGSKSPETVRRYAREILAWLEERKVKAIVVACNTATAHALEELIAAAQVPVIGVIEPGARAALAATRGGVIGVIGTAGTIRSGAYGRALRRLNPDVQVIEQACPLFVPLVEEGWFDHPATRLVAEEYLAPLRAAGVDTIVLGCTHYPMLSALIGDILGPSVARIDSAQETARELAAVLAARELQAPPGAAVHHEWAATDDVARFASVGERFVGEALPQIELATLGSEPVR